MSAVIEKHILKKHSEITKTTTTKIRKTWGQIDCTKDTNLIFGGSNPCLISHEMPMFIE